MAGDDDLPQVDPRRGVVLDATSEFALAIRLLIKKFDLSFAEVTTVVSTEMAFLARCEMMAKNKQGG